MLNIPSESSKNAELIEHFKGFSQSFIRIGAFLRVSLLLITIGGFLSIFRVFFNFLSLTSGEIIRGDLWRLVTSHFMERNIFILLWSIWSIRHISALLESVWGTYELTKFLFISQILSSVSIILVALLSYVFSISQHFFYFAEINGLSSACAAIFVATKQYLPDSILFTTSFGRLKNGHLPFCALCICILLAVCQFLRWIVVIQVLFGMQISWLYLRFYQRHVEDGMVGDPSDHFAWATLFPSKIQPPFVIFSSFIFAVSVRLRLCKPFIRRIDVSQLDHINILLPGLQTRDTERRRQKALRDLTVRLSRAQRLETDVWPEMDDIDENVHIVEKPITNNPPDLHKQAALHIIIEQESNMSSDANLEKSLTPGIVSSSIS